MYLTNVPTLENFALVLFFSVFGRNLILTSGLRATNVVTWLAGLDENTSFLAARYLFSWILRKLSCPWYLCCCDQQRWNLEHLNGPEHLCNFVSFVLCVSQSVFGTIQRRLACSCAGVGTYQSRSVVKFLVLHCFCEFVCLLTFSSQRRDFILYCCSQLRTCLAEC